MSVKIRGHAGDHLNLWQLLQQDMIQSCGHMEESVPTDVDLNNTVFDRKSALVKKLM